MFASDRWCHNEYPCSFYTSGEHNHISWSFQFQGTENKLCLIETEKELIRGSAEGQRSQEKGQDHSGWGELVSWRHPGPDATASTRRPLSPEMGLSGNQFCSHWKTDSPSAPPFAGIDYPQALPLCVINFQDSLDCWSLRYVSLFPRSPGKWDYSFCWGSFVRGSSASTRRVGSTSPEQTLYQEPGSRECVWKVISGSTSERVGKVRQRREEGQWKKYWPVAYRCGQLGSHWGHPEELCGVSFRSDPACAGKARVWFLQLPFFFLVEGFPHRALKLPAE